ncbi:DexA exonuclease A [Acinetobacter phage Acj9]|uniref:DexA exonuclease A n=1 Tax=Acinetobacter phage Acj9 TaxID=760939 RepID=E5EPF4_9CAUD|nr:DexA exonuclease A [Acinetobacter phage Acj9]ADG59920.1 DexA exonuclease A [Acinetobacter phage Acj9]
MPVYNDFVIDYETLDNKATAVVVDMSVVVFDPDPTKMQTFEELVAKGKRFKLSLASQKGVRTTNTATINWWREQSEAARVNLKASPDDLTVEEAIHGLIEFLKANNVHPKKSLGWCRGMSFDFPILVDMIRQTFKTDITDEVEPIKFWAQRDIRTAIEAMLLTRGLSKTPLRKGMLDGFVAHDSIHDCAKDVIMLKMAARYAMGLEDVPAHEDCDPETVKKR